MRLRRRYDAVGNLVALVDPALNVTSYRYDGLDRLMAETTAAGSRTREYNARGELNIKVDRNGRAEELIYDRLGRQTQEKWYVDRATANTPNTSDYSDALSWFYDALGRLTEQRDEHREPNGPGSYAFDYRVTDSWRYDGLDRVTEHSNQSLVNPTGA